MTVYIDTSAFLALMVHDDINHDNARRIFDRLAAESANIVTSSYVLLETLALLQRRIGLQSVWDFDALLFPLLEVIWVDTQWHQNALRRLLTINRRNVSLTDCLGFEIMKIRKIDTAFAFDRYFEEMGFAPVG